MSDQKPNGSKTDLFEDLPNDPSFTISPESLLAHSSAKTLGLGGSLDSNTPDLNSVRVSTDLGDGGISLDPRAPDIAESQIPAKTNYELIQIIGEGGCGEVWEATDASLARMVAVKKIRHNLYRALEDSTQSLSLVQQSFQQEAVATAQLEHPNIIPIHDLWYDETGSPALAMKRVKGDSWDHIIHEDLEEMEVHDFLAKHIPILIDVCQAVAFAHSRNIIHRDIKPAQVMVGEFGETVLMDWGLAVYLGSAIKSLGPSRLKPFLSTIHTATNPCGTPSLMAPEQATDETKMLGKWTDIYLLGGTLYFLLTGVYPHQAHNAQETIERAKVGDVPPPEERTPRRSVPPELSALAMAALNKNPSERIRSAKAFLRKLEEYLSGASRKNESVALTARAADLLERASQTYSSRSECLNLLNRANTLWDNNAEARELERRALIAYADLALEQGDLRLATLQAEKLVECEDRNRLLDQIKIAEDNLARQRKQRRYLTIGVIALLVAIILGGGAFLNKIADERKKQDALLYDMGERIKELTCIYGVSDAIRLNEDLDAVLSDVVALIPPAWQYPAVTTARITYDDREWLSDPFVESKWVQRADIVVAGKRLGMIEVFYTEERPTEFEGPFLAEERSLIDGIARLLSEEAEQRKFLHDIGERVKELNCIYSVIDLVRIHEDLDALMKETVALLPPAWQYPEVTAGRIQLGDQEWTTELYDPSADWRQLSPIMIDGQVRGAIEVIYVEQRPDEYEGPFLKEERHLLDAIAQILADAVENRVEH